MSYAPIQSEPSLNHQSPVQNKNLTRHKHSSSSGNLPGRKGQKARRTERQEEQPDPPIIVHCHLCWDWVWQRPQQFISRLSRRHKVLFVETMAPDAGLAAPLARFRVAENFPNVTVLTLQFPSWRWDDAAYVDAERRRLVQEFVA